MDESHDASTTPRLAGDRSPAQQTPAATHEDELAPGKALRDRQRASRSERMGNSTPTGGPVTSPPVTDEE